MTVQCSCDLRICPGPDDEADYVVHAPHDPRLNWCQHLARHLPAAVYVEEPGKPETRKQRRERERTAIKWQRGHPPAVLWSMRVVIPEGALSCRSSP